MNAEYNWQTGPITSPFGQAGRVGVNHDQPSQASQLYIHRFDNIGSDRGGSFQWVTPQAIIYLQTKTQATSWHRYVATGRAQLVTSDCWMIPVTTYTGSAQGTEPPQATPVMVNINVSP